MAVHGRQHIGGVTDELTVTEVGEYAKDSMAPMEPNGPNMAKPQPSRW